MREWVNPDTTCSHRWDQVRRITMVPESDIP